MGDSDRRAVAWDDALQEQAKAMCAIAKECSRRGWLPATAGNFSFCDRAAGGSRIFITASGLDKGNLTPADLLEIDLKCNVLAGPAKARPSAETSLHGVIYRERPEVRAIFHVHTVANTLLPDRVLLDSNQDSEQDSEQDSQQDSASEPNGARHAIVLEGYELLKALSGVLTHEHREVVPVLENSQDYAKLSFELGEALELHPKAHGVLLRRHGLYAWGESIEAAWRHLEALEFLFEVQLCRLTRD